MNTFLHTAIRKQLIFLILFFAIVPGMVAQTVIFSDDFETDQGWILSGEFERGTPAGGSGSYGEANPTSAYNGINVIGTDLDGAYPNDLTNRAYIAESPTIDCSGYTKITLNFQRWLNLERNAFDHGYIDYYDGTTWINIWENPNTTFEETSWSLQNIELPVGANDNPNVKIRFALGSTDWGYNYSGWNIDDIEVTGLEVPSGNLTDLVYWLRGDLGVTGTNPVTNWADQSGNGNDAFPGNGPAQITSADMNNQNVMSFNGIDDELGLADDSRINTNTGDGYNGDERTMVVAFKTDNNVTDTQYIYEEGGGTNGLGVYIKNGSVYVTVYNDGNAENRKTTYETVTANTAYVLSFAWDNGDLSASLNNIPFSNATSNGTISTLKSHGGDISIGHTDGTTRDETGTSVGGGLNIKGEIAEILYYDASLLEEEVLDISLELADRYGISFDPVTTYYSYQTGNWSASSTWTHDPGGTTQTANDVPGNNDKVVLLSGRTVSLTGDVNESNLDVTVREGAILNQSTHEFTSGLSALRGSGTHKLASVNYPGVTTNEFISTNGGTTEYNNSTDFTLLAAQTEYNNLRINAPGVTAAQLSNISLNGDLHIKQGTYQINDNTANRRQLIINGDVLVDNGASIITGTGNTLDGDVSGGTAPFTDYYDLNSHRVVVYGDFTNNGTVEFTNQSYPQFDAFPSNGMATVFFKGITNNTLTCNGTTDFYNLVLDKGIDQTYKLTVYATVYNNFRLFGRNNLGAENDTDNPNMRKALWIRTGTLELTGLTTIPSLTESVANGNPGGDFYIPVNGALVLNGPEVLVLNTADDYRDVNVAYNVAATSNVQMGIEPVGGRQSMSIYGTLQVDDGYFSTRESAGIITYDHAAGELVINGGIVDAKQYRADSDVGGLASFKQNGGEFLLRGRFQRTPVAYTNIANLKDFSVNTLNTDRDATSLVSNLGTFNLNVSENVFAMSGGTIRIYDVCGTGHNKAFQVFSDDANNNVTGGTLEIIPTAGTGTEATTYEIESTADIGNLTINRTSGTATVQLVMHTLAVLNDMTISAGEFITNDLDLSIGGNFTLESGTTYNAGTNTTFFNGTNNQSLTMNTGGAVDFYNFSLNSTGGKTLTLNGSDNILNVANTLSIQKGELADNGKTINVTGDIFNGGTHSGDGKIVLNSSADQTINGSGNGVFGNIELNNTAGSTAPVSLGANTTINGTLTFSQDKLFDISTYKLTFGSGATVANAGENRFIQTSGEAGDGGVTKNYSASATSFTFPVGTFSSSHEITAEYTPATLSFGTNPNSFGNITIVPVGYEHPNTTTKDRSLTYFWRVKSEGFDLGTATVNHSFQYAQSDVVNNGDVSEVGYVAAKYDNSTYSWTTYGTGDVNITSNTIGGAGTALEAVNFIDGEFTAGDNVPTDPFGEPTVFYSRINGLDAGNGRWDNGNNWSTDGTLKHEGEVAAAFPEAGDIAVIGGKDSIFLLSWDETADRSPQYAATLKIEDGSALDIGYNPGSSFSVVLNHENGNGNFRITCDRGPLDGSTVRTFEFPSGDYSDFNTNQGTTELYTTNDVAGTTFYLPNGVESYGSLIISPLGGSNIIFPNNDLLIYGNLITRGQNSLSWYCPNWRANYPTAPTTPVAKTITINGDFHMQGGALVWYSRNNTGEQDFVVGGDFILDSETGVKVHTNGNGNSQSVTIGGSLINNALTPGGGVNEYRGADFTDIPLIFNGAGTHSITNDDPADNTYTVIESLTLDKGESQANELIVDITGTFTTPTDNWLTLVNGTFKYLHNDNLTLTEGSEFIIPSTAGLYINSPGNIVYLANDNVNDNDVYLQGKLTVVDGDVRIGDSDNDNNNDIEYAGGGDSEIDIQGGSLTVNGQIRRNPSTSAGILKYSQSGGDVTINGRSHNTDNAKLEVLNDGSEFNMSGGTLTIVRGGGAGTYGDLYLRPETSTVTGGEIIFNPNGAGAQSYIFDANVPVYDLTTTSNADVKLMVSALTLKNDLLINNAGTLNANVNFDIPVTIKGDFTNDGTYAHQRNTTTFSGGEQTISGASAITFYDAVVAPVTSVSIDKEITVNHDLTLSNGTLICDANNVNVEGDVTNNANYTDANSGIILNGRDLQYVDGTGTWGQLELDNASGARLSSSITLQNNLVLTAGVFDVNSELLTLGENADIVGTNFSSSKMITSDGTFSDVGVSKSFSSADNNTEFLFPLGTSGKYTPVNLTIDNIGNSGSIRVNNINDHHPGVIDVDNVLAYFWDVENTGITDFSGSLEFNYLDDDVKVDGHSEGEYIGAHLLVPGTSWSKIDNVDDNANTITFPNSGSLSGEYTAGIDVALPNEVPTFITNQSGDWSNPAIWTQTDGDSYTLTGAPNGFILTIDDDHTVVTNTSYASSYRIQIRGILEVSNGTYGHNLGTVTGAGKLYLENGTFPAGRFDGFFSCANNSTLEYGGTTNYDLVADLWGTVPNLHFTGTGSRTLPNKDLTICKQLLIDGATVDNSVNNRKLSVLGTMERYNSGSFVSGTGINATVAFAGSAEQTIGGALGDFSGSSAFNNLEIDNPAGLTINENGDIEVSGKLILTDGLINTSATNQVAITNTSSNSVAPIGGHSNSFVNGPLTKTIIQGDNFNFPIGKDGELGNKLVLLASEAGTIDWTVEYFTPNDTYTSYNAPLSYVNSYDRWSVSAAVGSKAKVGIKWNANSDLTPANTQYGNSDMRVTMYDENNSVWNELSSTASGSNILGTVTTVSKVTIPAGGYSLFSTACINTIKPRAKLTPTGPICGTGGIPVSFSSSPTLEYLLSYTLNGVAQSDIAVTSTPFVLPTQSGGGVYKLTAFTYSNGTKTGAVDQSEITAYEQPEVASAGEDQSLCGLTQADISGEAPSVGSVLWSVTSGEGGSIVAPTSQTTTFNGTNGSGYTLTYTVDNGGCTASDDVEIDFPVLAAQPGNFIVSSSDVCQTESGVEYTVPNDATVNYIWGFDNNGTTGDGDDGLVINGSDNSITADFGDVTITDNEKLYVMAKNDCGESAPRTVEIAIHPMPQVTFESDDADNVICENTDITFTVTETSGLSVLDIDFHVDGVSVHNGTDTEYTTDQLTNGTEVKAIVTSDEGCSTNSDVLSVSVGGRIWDGHNDEYWSNNGNWTCGNAPSKEYTVVIPPAPTRMPVINSNAECGGLTVKSGATVTLQGTNVFDIYGNWNNEGTFNANEGTVNFRGDVELNGSADLTFNHLTIHNGVKLTSSDDNLNITGNFTNNGTFIHNSGTVTFNGAAAQSIDGAFTGANALNNIVIDNGSGVSLASGNKQIDGTLTLTNGALKTNGLLTLGQNAVTNISAASGRVSSYIDGALSKVILGNDYFFFPIGSGTLYKPVGITAANSPGVNTWTAAYDNGAPTEHPVKEGDEIVRVSNQESWTLSSTASEASIQLSWDAVFNGDIYVDNDQLNSLRVAHLNNSNEWETVGSGSASGGGSDFGTVTSGSTIIFDGSKAGSEKVTLASTSSEVHPLPVDLSSFYGKALEGNVKLNWTTLSETDNDYFEVQHSTDAETFSTIGTVQGAGNSTEELDYTLTDNSPVRGVNYYRLKQVDYDGTVELHHTIAVHFEGLSLFDNNSVSVYPNPYSNGDLTLEFTSVEPNTPVVVTVTSLDGTMVFQTAMELPYDGKIVNPMPEGFDQLANGIYLIHVKTAANTVVKRLMIY